jgi:hypothetical protein
VRNGEIPIKLILKAAGNPWHQQGSLGALSREESRNKLIAVNAISFIHD